MIRALAENMLKSAGPLDTSSEPPVAIQSLVTSATLRELQADRVVFHHDVLRDWAIGCLLHEDPTRLADLPLGEPAPETLIRGFEIAARLGAERATDDVQWLVLPERLSQPGVHGSWRRAALLALVRSENGGMLLNRASKNLFASGGALLKELIHITVAVDSEPGVTAFAKFGIKLPSLLPDFVVPSALSWGRLIVWSLAVMRDIPNDVIPDLVDLYSRWSTAKFGHDPLTPYLLDHWYTWLTEIESALYPDHFTGLRRPFGLAMSSERERDLEANLRMYFLAFCQRRPGLAERYLRSIAQRRPQDSIAREIMKFRGSGAQAAPVALADLTLRTLIPPPDEDEHFGSAGYDLHGPFGVYDSSFFPASPAQGPMLELLVHSPENGLRVIRQLIDVAINHFSGGREHGQDAVIIRFPTGDRAFPWIRSYNWSRDGSHSSIVTSALMALEAWGHRRIEAGESVDVVAADILGPAGAPAAFLLVAVDLLISHWPKSAKEVIPFLACPELLSIDRSRFAYEGLSSIGGEKEPNGLATLQSLRERASRRVSLDGIIGNYTQGSPELLATLQRELSTAAARVGPVDNEASMKDVRFAAAHAVNLANPANWHEVTFPTTDGSMGTAFEYRSPAQEEALINAVQLQLQTKQFDGRLRIALTMAIGDRRRSSPDLVAHAVAWAQTQHTAPESTEDNDIGDKDSHTQAKVTAAALAMRDGDDSVVAAHETWGRNIFAEALGAPDDHVGNHPLLPYNTVAIAMVGLISLVRRRPDAAGIRNLVEIAARPDQAILPAFSAELTTLNEIDERLPRAMLRVGFASLFQALHDYREPKEALAARVEAHRQRVIAAIERELAWLNGGKQEPIWPPFPIEPPRPRYGRRLRLLTGDDDAVLQDQEERKRPLDIVNSQGGAVWIEKALPLLQPASVRWFRGLVDAYAEWTALANGAGLADDDDPDRSPLEWNIAYFDLAARTLAGLSPDEIDRSALQRIFTLPDESFFDVMATLIRTLDELYFNLGQIDAAEALRLRSRLAQRLVQSRGWRRVTERKSSSIESHIGRAIASLFFHNEIWGGGKCYINPSGAEKMNGFLPLLSDLAVDAASSQYVVTMFMDLIELRVHSGNLGYLVRSACAWLSSYPADTAFWVDLGMGRRVCEWLAEAMRTDAGTFLGASAPIAEIDRLLDALVRIGAAAARPVEESLARLRRSNP